MRSAPTHGSGCGCSLLAFSLVAAGEAEVPLEWNSGSNGYVYWVSNYLGGPLTQLPHVTPAQVRQQQHHSAGWQRKQSCRRQLPPAFIVQVAAFRYPSGCAAQMMLSCIMSIVVLR
jgi:hypothetical protein